MTINEPLDVCVANGLGNSAFSTLYTRELTPD